MLQRFVGKCMTNRISIKTLLIIFSLLIITSCYTIIDKSKIGNNTQIKPITDSNVFLPDSTFRTDNYSIKDLYQNWVNINEIGRNIIWGPKQNANLPTRRFRESIIFKRNGEYLILRLSPTDAHYYEKYRWRLSKEDYNEIIIFNTNGERIDSMSITKLDSVTLEFKEKE